jgi:multidrug efflux pump subunit AcrA (membrane-fusion protein)
MSIGTMEANATKHAIYDKLESQIKTAEAKLATLKARAEVAKANAEIKAITDLLPRKEGLHRKLQELKKSGEDRWEVVKNDLMVLIADFEKSVKEIEAKAKAL